MCLMHLEQCDTTARIVSEYCCATYSCDEAGGMRGAFGVNSLSIHGIANAMQLLVGE